MHIIIVSRVLPHHSIGGMQVITWDLAKQFAQQGLEVTCLTTSIPGFPEHFIEDGVRVVALDNTTPGKHSRYWWKSSKRYIEENHLNNCDVLLSVSAAGFEILKLKLKMKNTIFIFQGHGTSLSEIISKIRLHTLKSLLSIVKNIKWLPIDLIKYKRFDGIVAAGERVNRDFSNKLYSLFLKNSRIKYIPNGINTNEFKPSLANRDEIRKSLELNDNDFVILVASRLHQQKGIEKAIVAFNKYLCSNRVKLLILGTGPYEEGAKKKVEDLGLYKDVIFKGAVSIKDLTKYINASDVYLFPTLHEEGLPLLPLEALACGVPVLASNHLKEICGSSDQVFPIEPRNIDSIISNLDKAKIVRAGNISFLPEIYTIEGVANQYIAFFMELKNER